MLTFYKDMLNKIGFETEDLIFLTEKGEKLITCFPDEIKEIIKIYKESNFSDEANLRKREALSEKSGEDIAVINLVYLICATEILREKYLEKGYSEDMFINTAKDLKYKSLNHKILNGFAGISNHSWHNGFFRMSIMALGRLQYQKQNNWFEKPYTYGDITINPNDEIYYIHIPEAGPLTKELREESYKLAYKYLDKVNGKVYLACNSWLLCDKNPEILGEDNNTVSFMRDFDIYEGFVREADDNLWRIFGYKYDGKPENLPKNTKMQKKVAEWYEKGGHLGIGRGFIILDEHGRYNK